MRPDEGFKNLDVLADEFYFNAINKGFRGPGIANEAYEQAALIHSELSEALEAIRHGDPPDDKIPEFSGTEAELADTIIRILDYCRSQNFKLQKVFDSPYNPPDFDSSEFQSGGSVIGRLHTTIATAFQGYHTAFATALNTIKAFANHKGYRLAEAILAKNAYNSTRPYKHGGKKF